MKKIKYPGWKARSDKKSIVLIHELPSRRKLRITAPLGSLVKELEDCRAEIFALQDDEAPIIYEMISELLST